MIISFLPIIPSTNNLGRGNSRKPNRPHKPKSTDTDNTNKPNLKQYEKE